MNTHELLVEFIKKGGVITLHNSGDADKPIRFSLKYNRLEWVGKTSNLDSALIKVLEPPQDHENDMWHSAFDR